MVKNKLKGKKANILAVILVTTILIATIALHMQVKSSNLKDNPTLGDSKETIDFGIDQSIRDGFVDFAENGMAQNSLWFCNYAMTPKLAEVKESLEESVNSHLLRNLENLEDKGYEIDIPEIITDIQDSISELDENQVEITLEDVRFTYQDENGKEIKTFNKTEDIATKIWLIYKTLKEWTVENNDLIVEELEENVFSDKCQFKTCCCDIGGMNTALIEERKSWDLFAFGGDMSELENYYAKEEDVVRSIAATVENLNEEFDQDTGITCSYDIIEVETDNYPVFNFEEYPKGIIGNCDYDCNTVLTSAFLGEQNDGVIKELDKSENIGPTCPEDEGLDRDITLPTIFPNEKLRSEETEIKDTYPEILQQYRYTDQYNMVESIGIDKAAKAHYKIVCSDPNYYVVGTGGYKALSVSIEMEFNYKFDCKNPPATSAEYYQSGVFICDIPGPPVPGCPPCYTADPDDPTKCYIDPAMEHEPCRPRTSWAVETDCSECIMDVDSEGNDIIRCEQITENLGNHCYDRECSEYSCQVVEKSEFNFDDIYYNDEKPPAMCRRSTPINNGGTCGDAPCTGICQNGECNEAVTNGDDCNAGDTCNLDGTCSNGKCEAKDGHQCCGGTNECTESQECCFESTCVTKGNCNDKVG